jgi:hypothetical protein
MTADETVEVDPRHAIVESQIHPIVTEALSIHARTETNRTQEGGAPVLDHPGSHPLQDMVPGTELEYQRLDTRLVEQNGQQGTGRAAPYDDDRDVLSRGHAFGHRTTVR